MFHLPCCKIAMSRTWFSLSSAIRKRKEMNNNNIGWFKYFIRRHETQGSWIWNRFAYFNHCWKHENTKIYFTEIYGNHLFYKIFLVRISERRIILLLQKHYKTFNHFNGIFGFNIRFNSCSCNVCRWFWCLSILKILSVFLFEYIKAKEWGVSGTYWIKCWNGNNDDDDDDDCDILSQTNKNGRKEVLIY